MWFACEGKRERGGSASGHGGPLFGWIRPRGRSWWCSYGPGEMYTSACKCVAGREHEFRNWPLRLRRKGSMVPIGSEPTASRPLPPPREPIRPPLPQGAYSSETDHPFHGMATARSTGWRPRFPLHGDRSEATWHGPAANELGQIRSSRHRGHLLPRRPLIPPPSERLPEACAWTPPGARSGALRAPAGPGWHQRSWDPRWSGATGPGAAGWPRWWTAPAPDHR